MRSRTENPTSNPTWAPNETEEPRQDELAELLGRFPTQVVYDNASADPAEWIDYINEFNKCVVPFITAELNRLYQLEDRVWMLENAGPRRRLPGNRKAVAAVLAAGIGLSALALSNSDGPEFSTEMAAASVAPVKTFTPAPTPKPEPTTSTVAPPPLTVPTTTTEPPKPAPTLPAATSPTEINIPAAGYKGEWDSDIKNSFTRDDAGIWRTIRWSGVDVSGRVLPEPGDGPWSVLVVPAKLGDVEVGQEIILGGDDWTVYRVDKVAAADQETPLDAELGDPNGADVVVLIDGVQRSDNPEADLRPTVWVRR